MHILLRLIGTLQIHFRGNIQTQSDPGRLPGNISRPYPIKSKSNSRWGTFVENFTFNQRIFLLLLRIHSSAPSPVKAYQLKRIFCHFALFSIINIHKILYIMTNHFWNIVKTVLSLFEYNRENVGAELVKFPSHSYIR